MASHRVRGDKIRKTVILDSSAVLSFFEFSVDWQQELGRLLGSYHIVVPQAVAQELQVLAKRQRGGKNAAAGLKLIAPYEVLADAAQDADQACLNLALRTKGIVATNDTALRQRLKQQGVPVVFLRGKKRLALDE
ncbi:MAG: hypothetical protein JXA00_05495 [Candidatus Thermoplasmatota archaeon]|nr:hypothetical protein [Candidatus Thermoplasmatota archaeon]